MTGPSDDALARLAATQHGVFAAFQLADLKFSDDARHARIAAGRWEILYDGVYRMGGAPKTWRGDLLAACWAGGAGTLASHRSAAELWGLPSARADLIELTCARWKRTRQPGLRVHESTRIDDPDRAVVANIPCTSVTRTLFDLARSVSSARAHARAA